MITPVPALGEVTSDDWHPVLFPWLRVMSGDTGLLHLPQDCHLHLSWLLMDGCASTEMMS